MDDLGSEASIQHSSARLVRLITILYAALWTLLILERFGWIATSTNGSGGPSHTFLQRFGFQLVAAGPEVMYLLSLWWIRQALASYARGDLYEPIVPRMLRRTGTMLAIGALLNVFVVPGIDRALGMGRGYWIAFDVGGLVLGAIGLSLVVVARMLDRVRELKAELDEIF